MDQESYRRGHEDAIELCLSELCKSKSVEEAKTRVQKLLGLIKEYKIERLKQDLGVLGG